MGCLEVKATLMNLPLVVGFSVLSGIECSASVLNQPLRINASKVTPRLKIQCGLVCSAGGGYYLRVKPDTVWLSPDDLASATFDIYSNDSWRITNEDSDVPYLDVSKNQVWVSMGEYDLFNIFSNVNWNID